MAATLQHCQCYSSCIHIVNVTLNTSTLHTSTLPTLLFMHPVHPHCQCALHTSTLPMCSSYIHIANVTLHISTLPMLLFIHPHFHCYSRSIFMHLTIQRLQEYRIKFTLVVDNVVDFLSRKFMYSGNVVVDYYCSCCSQSNSITYQLQTVDDKTCYVLYV